MEQRLIDRIFEEIDHNSKQNEDLAKVVYEVATSVGIINKILIGLFMIIIGGFISHVFFVDHVKSTFEEDTKVMIEKYEKKHREIMEEYKEIIGKSGSNQKRR